MSNPYSNFDIEAIRAMNASMTQAGHRSRPGRGAASRGRPTAAAFRMNQSVASRPNVVLAAPRSGSGVGSTSLSNAVRVGSVSTPRAFKAASPPRPRPSSPVRMQGSHVAEAPTALATGSKSKMNIIPTRTPGLEPLLHGLDRSMQPRAETEGAQVTSQNHVANGRELIVTNMTPSDPSKPWIPSHLQQRSAYEAIKHIAELTDMDMSELTTDGVTIPAPRDRTRPVSRAEEELSRSPEQMHKPDIDAVTWFTSTSHSAPPNRNIQYSNDLGSKEVTGYMYSVHDVTLQVERLHNHQSTNHIRGPSSSMDVEMENATDSSDRRSSLEARLSALPRLGDSIWAREDLETTHRGGSGPFGSVMKRAPPFKPSDTAPLQEWDAQARVSTASTGRWVGAGAGQRSSAAVSNTTQVFGEVVAEDIVTGKAVFTGINSNAVRKVLQSEAPTKPEKKVQYLKDSIWAR